MSFWSIPTIVFLWEATGELWRFGGFFFFLSICKLMFGFKQISCSTSVIQFSVNVSVLSSVNVKHSLYIQLQ